MFKLRKGEKTTTWYPIFMQLSESALASCARGMIASSFHVCVLNKKTRKQFDDCSGMQPISVASRLAGSQLRHDDSTFPTSKVHP